MPQCHSFSCCIFSKIFIIQNPKNRNTGGEYGGEDVLIDWVGRSDMAIAVQRRDEHDNDGGGHEDGCEDDGEKPCGEPHVCLGKCIFNSRGTAQCITRQW